MTYGLNERFGSDEKAIPVDQPCKKQLIIRRDGWSILALCLSASVSRFPGASGGTPSLKMTTLIFAAKKSFSPFRLLYAPWSPLSSPAAFANAPGVMIVPPMCFWVLRGLPWSVRSWVRYSRNERLSCLHDVRDPRQDSAGRVHLRRWLKPHRALGNGAGLVGIQGNAGCRPGVRHLTAAAGKRPPDGRAVLTGV